MAKYRPFEQKRKNMAPIIWAVSLGLFAVALFFGLVLVEERLVFTENGLFFDFASEEMAPKEEVPEFVKVPEIVIENTPESEVPPEEERCYPTAISKDAVFALSAPFSVTVEELGAYNVNTVILTLQDGSGTLVGTGEEIARKVSELQTAGYKVIARISVYADDAFAVANPKSALKSISQTAWQDNNGHSWANPYSSVFNDHFAARLEEYKALPVDGYLFENAAFPYDGKIQDCYYIDDNPEERTKEVEATADAIKAAIRERPVWYLLDVPTVLTDGANQVTGVNIRSLAQKGIGVVPLLTVSSVGNLAYELSEENYCNPVEYQTVESALQALPDVAPDGFPLMEVKGEVNLSFMESMKSNMEKIRGMRPGYFGISLDWGVYEADLFRLLGNEGEWILRDIHTPEPSTETDEETTETEVSSEIETDSEVSPEPVG